MTYSQLNQDRWVLEYFKTGVFVDVGFNDGLNLSNTKLLEDNGWTGIGIDPFPKNFNHRPNTIVEVACVYNKPTTVEFICASDLGGISEHIDAHKNHEWVINGKKITIDANTLEYFLVKHNMPSKIEYLSIDTEGSEYEILSVFPFSKYRFGCITCEHNNEIVKRTKIIDLLIPNNYVLIKTLGVDDCFIHSSVLNNNFYN